jgi:hypothetical protein
LDLAHIERPFVFFHGDCGDGWCSAWLAAQRWPDAELAPVNYGDLTSDPLPGIFYVGDRSGARRYDLNGRHVLILDFSFPREVLLAMKEAARSILVLDHHRTAATDLAGLDFAIFDMERSGAGLSLDYFFPGLRARGLAAVRFDWRRYFLATRTEDTDLWRFGLPESKAVRAALACVPKTLEAWDDLDVYALESKGRAILSYQDAMVERIAEHAYPITWPEGEILACNSPVLQSEVGNVLALRAPTPLRTALVWYRNEGKTRCSLRSVDGGADVSLLAKARGGGGHVHAAGFENESAP